MPLLGTHGLGLPGLRLPLGLRFLWLLPLAVAVIAALSKDVVHLTGGRESARLQHVPSPGRTHSKNNADPTSHHGPPGRASRGTSMGPRPAPALIAEAATGWSLEAAVGTQDGRWEEEARLPRPCGCSACCCEVVAALPGFCTRVTWCIGDTGHFLATRS